MPPVEAFALGQIFITKNFNLTTLQKSGLFSEGNGKGNRTLRFQWPFNDSDHG